MHANVELEEIGPFCKRLHFDHVDARIDFGPAFTDMNPVYRAASMAILGPFETAARLGRISHERSEDLLIECYVRGGVVIGSPDDHLKGFGEDEWISWFHDHRLEFKALQSISEVRSSWDPNARTSHADGTSSATPGHDLPQPDGRGDGVGQGSHH